MAGRCRARPERPWAGTEMTRAPGDVPRERRRQRVRAEDRECGTKSRRGAQIGTLHADQALLVRSSRAVQTRTQEGIMSLERFYRTRMVVLNSRSTAYQAARAMESNHVGAVLVSDRGTVTGIITDRDLALAVLGAGLDARATRLAEVMSEEVVTCDIKADIDTVVSLMREHGVRRVPLVEDGKPVGLITFDDLVVDSSVSLEALRSIVTAQLEVEAPHKPAGVLHPDAGRTAQSRTRALMR